MKTGYLIAAIGVALAIILGLQYYVFDSPDQSAPTPGIVAVPKAPGAVTADEPQPLQPSPLEPAVEEPIPAEPPLPLLADSDDWLRGLLGDLPFPSSWLEIDQLLRRGAAVLDNLAQGTYPRAQLGFLLPREKFPVVRDGERFYVDPAGYTRFDYLSDLLESVPPQRLAEIWQRSRPMLVEALAELGQTESPETLLRQALDHMRDVPLLAPEELELVRPGVQFAFRADELERRNDLQKQLLRMGPDNIQRLRDRLSLLLDSLGTV